MMGKAVVISDTYDQIGWLCLLPTIAATLWKTTTHVQNINGGRAILPCYAPTLRRGNGCLGCGGEFVFYSCSSFWNRIGIGYPKKAKPLTNYIQLYRSA